MGRPKSKSWTENMMIVNAQVDMATYKAAKEAARRKGMTAMDLVNDAIRLWLRVNVDEPVIAAPTTIRPFRNAAKTYARPAKPRRVPSLRNRDIFVLYKVNRMTQATIGRMYGLTPQRVCQIVKTVEKSGF